MRSIESIIEEKPEPPAQLRLACGHDVPHAIGQEIYNYYDMRRGVIERLAKSYMAQPDTSGLLPNGVAWWVDTTAGYVDGSRMCCVPCAAKRGYRDAE